MDEPPPEFVVFTAGHGNRSIEEFLALLSAHGVRCLVDIRAYPVSRRHPHFAREPLARSLAAQGVSYRGEGKDLGGFRRARGQSRHTALHTPGFRAFCDHMESERFADAVQRLLALAQESPTTVMCAERLPWHCHRYFLSDYLLLRGACVRHLVAEDETIEHRLNPLARVEEGRLVYDRGVQQELY